jgi:predicted AAA+ superfamily ATPase
MDKNELFSILNDWNFWRHELETGVARRAYIERFKDLSTSNQVITVTGPRRAGKSYLMRQIGVDLMSKGLKKDNLLYVNFEDPRFASLDTQLMNQIFSTYKEFLAPQGEVTVFMDEVQEVEGWEKWIRMMHELKKAKLIISGSNAKLLSRELGTLLTGRHLDLSVFPLSFREFLAFNGLNPSDKIDLVNQETDIKGLLRRYIEFGSFPEVVLSQQKKEILLGYFEDLVTKDLLRRFKIRKSQALKSLIKYYLSNAGTLTTFSSIEKFLKLSTSTVEKFSGYLEDVYLVFFLKRFSFKVKEQEKSPRKVYAIDTGLCNSIGFRFSENIGKLAENIVFLELHRRQIQNSDTELYYWKDVYHHEVDFVVKKGQKVGQLIQVCWNVSDPKTKDREIRSLMKAMDELEKTEATIITEEYDTVEELKDRKITYVSLWRWLLAE